jgi:hypothetical protein
MTTDNSNTVKQAFSLGLSLLTDSHRQNLRAGRSGEGQRVLRLLDRDHTGNAVIRTETLGRPYFADCHADFNISHSRFLAAVSFRRDRNPRSGLPYRTGCDVEYLNPRQTTHNERIIRRFFDPEEQSYINASATGLEYQRRFFRIWTLKECFIKLKGLSVVAMPEAPVFSLAPDFPLAAMDTKARSASYRLNRNSRNNPSLVFYLFELGTEQTDQYILATAWETNPEENPQAPELRWFSPETLPVNKPVISIFPL